MAQKPCVTGLAYEMRRALQGIYGRKDAEEARKLFGNWCAWVQAMRERPGELLEPAARVGHAPARYARLRVTYPAGVVSAPSEITRIDTGKSSFYPALVLVTFWNETTGREK